ncbi:hypothetical protein Aph01nite_40870 [Acrocarpospora phusangensis]|uniref:Band 7 domain-containing protein n=1 Tax=Acrocarpospora phusangensis TaxID=1070424 RepID=A0A919QBC0_9ACTN|nr:SPFH domain-containing protein [Acrocarpospora phusangensis]GIH25777.1 hypothetical protein Aph01nite_40870 [Acrocarpospora phusangensis]
MFGYVLPAATGTPLVWGLVAGLVLAVLAAGAVRVVPLGQRLVVFRFGRPVAVKGPGLAAVLPGADRDVRVPLGATRLDLLWLDAVTRDEVAVTVNGTGLASVTDPIAYADNPASTGAATLAVAEAEVRAYVATRDLAELTRPAEDDLDGLSARISARTRRWGVEVTVIEFSRVEVRLKADLIRWAERYAARAEHAAVPAGRDK